MPRSASIYFVDSDLASRRRLIEHLGRRGFEIWPFDSAERLLVVLDMLPPSCILLNIGPDRGRDIELVKCLSERTGGWPIIVLDAEPDVATAVAAMHAGAADFLENSDDHAPLEHALGTAMASLDRMLAADCSRQDAQTRLARLTPREKEVATSLIGGLSNKRTAYLLGISVRTVEMHRSHLLAKLAVRNIAEAAALLAGVGFGGTTGPAAEAERVGREGPASRQLSFAD